LSIVAFCNYVTSPLINLLQFVVGRVVVWEGRVE
jgi:hypothetical protein